MHEHEFNQPLADEHLRIFWALFIGSTLERHDLPGFKTWLEQNGEERAGIVNRVGRWATVKIQRDKRDPDECITAAVRYARDQMRLYKPSSPLGVDPSEVRSLITTLSNTLGWDQKKPIQFSKAHIEAEQLKAQSLIESPEQV